jgi:NAD(P)-dependent dehydrogenase (short-subunit alcohol dehydrogenase family)
MLLKDQVCIIAGAASLRSIGYATAELFVEHGAKVVVTDVSMNEDVLANIKKQIETRLNKSINLYGFQCDISRKSECDDLISKVMAIHGSIDCLVNSAGIVRSGSILDIQEAEMSLMLTLT